MGLPFTKKALDDLSATALVELAAAAESPTLQIQSSLVLRSIMQDLLEREQDQTIDEAIEIAPNTRIARRIRHCAESVSERIILSQEDNQLPITLFAIPVLISFTEDIPATQVESALRGLLSSAEFASQWKGMSKPFDQIMLLPEFFRLEKLMGLPFSRIRQATLAFSMISQGHEGMPLPLDSQGGSFKRSSAFLRFAVGILRGLRADAYFKEESGPCALLQSSIRHAIASRMGVNCEVRCTNSGAFHESLYAGMWDYQELRLDQICCRLKKSLKDIASLDARILTTRQRDCVSMCVAFFAEGQAVGQRAYLLRARPGETVAQSTWRMALRMHAAGIRTFVCDASWMMEGEGISIPGLGAGQAIVPIPI